MKSSSVTYFPQFRFTDTSKYLFNPVLKKRFSNRPEERVRLQFVDYLLTATGFSKNRIGFEAPIHLPDAEHTLRADLVLYNRLMKPFALIECKSAKISLTEKTGQQVANYNRQLEASYLMITNGIEEKWYHLGDAAPVPSDSPLNEYLLPAKPQRTENYWTERGFICPDSAKYTKALTRSVLEQIMISTQSPHIQYLDFPSTLAPFYLDHYYRITNLSTDTKIAFTPLDSGKGSTMLAAVVNRAGKNRGVLWISLDDLSTQKNVTAAVLSESGNQEIPVPTLFINKLKSRNEEFLKNIGEELLIFFD